MKIGYIRKNSDKKDVVQQIHAITNYGCEDIRIESNEKNSEELWKAVNDLQKQECLVLCSWKDLGMRIKKVQAIIQTIANRGAGIIVLEKKFNSLHSESVTFVDIVNMLAESESKVISEHTISSLKKIEVKGRPPIEQATKEKIFYLRNTKKQSYRKIAEECNVSIGTVYKYLNAN